MSVVNEYLLNPSNVKLGKRAGPLSDYESDEFCLVCELVCADGFRMSVQASGTHYCQPRNNEGPWHMVEVGFPSAIESLLPQYAEDVERPTDTVYPYVPAEVVEAVIAKHGSIAAAETSK